MGEFVELAAADGHHFAAWVAAPAGKARGAVVIAPEIFGVNGHIRSVADGYAADGYLAIAPALFDRVQRKYDTGYTPDEIQAGMAIKRQIDFDDALKDIAAAVAHGQQAGQVGVIGYCWGGTIAWLAAAHLAGLACAVPYYGGNMYDFIEATPKCPVTCHFGEHDKSPSPEQARALLAAHPEVIGHFYDAGHGFNCDRRASFDARSSELARSRTLQFLAQHVG